MKVVVGLGNPGEKYDSTRHNVGFAVLAELGSRFSAARPQAKFQGELTEIRVGQEKVVLAYPLTYMNLSGRCVGPLLAFYKLPLDDLLVVCDDLSLPLGKIRLRGQGSSGGQKGLQDIIRVAGSQAFPRLRLGIGATPAGWETADFVLSKFSTDELPLVKQMVNRAAEAVVEWVQLGLGPAMNRFNRDSGQ
jgi:PTH1 family peptidyl-tRNA hydrolase